ncbi:MAG: DUF4145 domain-containing protein [Pirellulaceae bacterium]|nr:DUF4145 domain-containing protein [Pirellulaceae bacterium]
MINSPNFGFLDDYLAEYALRAERYVFEDTNTCLIKLRQFAERLARHVLEIHDFEVKGKSLNELLQCLRGSQFLPPQIRSHFYLLRDLGNEAAHEGKGDEGTRADKRDAYRTLIAARELAMWYQRTFIKSDERFGPFRPPPSTSDLESDLRAELAAQRDVVARYEIDLSFARGKVVELEKIKQDLESEALQYYESLQTMGEERDAERIDYEEELRRLRESVRPVTDSGLASFVTRAQQAAESLGLTPSDSLHVPLAQIRVVFPRESRCCHASQLLAQSATYGFVKSYCTKCGISELIYKTDFMELELWVACPNGHGRMKPTYVGKIYGYECPECHWRCCLASLLPQAHELGIKKTRS